MVLFSTPGTLNKRLGESLGTCECKNLEDIFVMSKKAAKAVAATLSIREFLDMPEASRPKLLRETELKVGAMDGSEISVVVRQLTKAQADHFQRRITAMMPEVPYIEHDVKVAQRQPDGTIKPAGRYKEQNPKDPNYLRSMELWFNDATVWLALYSIHGSLGVEVASPEMDSLYERLGTMFPPNALLELAVNAAHCNPGLALAEQVLQSHVASSLNDMLTRELFAQDEGAVK
ncbi:MAG: hypothetical protein MZV70_29190 [Desulfobacterales bacterium]|nr:hypothetical protein [Desulfobacterales bacterium]